MSRKFWFIVIAIAVLAGAAVLALRLRGPEVETVIARAAPLVQTVVVTGRVASQARVFLGATITGRVQDVRYREGATVREGEAIVRLEDAELSAGVRQADAQLRTAVARLDSQNRLAGPVASRQEEQARANALTAERERERYEALFRRGFVGQSRLDEARRAAEVAKSQELAAQAQAAANLKGGEFEQARTRVAEARAALALARARLEQTRIIAPGNGVVLARLVEPGQIVQPGARLIEMSVDGPVQVVAQVDEKFLGQLKPGQAASVAADAFPAQPAIARVRSIAPLVDAQRASVEVKFSFDALPAWITNDMTVSIEIETARRERAIALPGEALRAGPTVLVLEDGKAVVREVKTGIRTLTTVEILEGIAEGATVVTDPGIAAGVRVRPIPRRTHALGNTGSGAEGITRAMGG